jgi:hypothetical protein
MEDVEVWVLNHEGGFIMGTYDAHTARQIIDGLEQSGFIGFPRITETENG